MSFGRKPPKPEVSPPPPLPIQARAEQQSFISAAPSLASRGIRTGPSGLARRAQTGKRSLIGGAS